MAFINIGGRYPVMRSRPVLRFRQRGTTFPDSFYVDHNFPGYTASQLIVFSSEPNTVTVDYGDGTVLVYDFVFSPEDNTYRFGMAHLNEANQAAPGQYSYHQYAGTAGDIHRALPEHVVSFIFEKSNSIISWDSTLIPIYGTFPSDFGMMLGLETLNIRFASQITDFPAAFGRNTSIKNLVLRQIGPVMDERIPDEFFSLPLEKLEVSESVNLSDPISSNFSKINLLKNTITSFFAITCEINDCPPELTECINLKALNIMGNKFSECPPEVNSLVNLESLSFVYINSNLTGWGDFSSCTKLISIDLRSNLSGTLTTDLPIWLNALTKWKQCVCYGSFGQTQERTDTWVTNVYNFVVANAPMTGTSSDPFRNMAFNMFLPPGHSHLPYTKRPSGTYQQPAGYVQGSSNGTPASPMERIWVLTNQYGHTWTVLPA